MGAGDAFLRIQNLFILNSLNLGEDFTQAGTKFFTRPAAPYR